jgi:processing peptidase subunit beta
MFPARRLLSTSAAAASSAARAPVTQVSTLGNGLRVASEQTGGPLACVGVWVDAGSRSETAANNGVAHFLEHMAFKGTQQRTQRQLEVEIENMGGHLNAFTSREQTVYYASVFEKDVPAALNVLGDILLNAEFDQAAIDRERGVILRECEEVDKMPEEVLFDKLHETAFQGSGLAQTILGPAENIMRITRDDLTSYVNRNYVASKMVVAGAGAVKHEQLVELSDKLFGGLPTESSEPGALVTPPTPEFIGSEIRVRNDNDPLAHVVVGFEGPSATSAEAVPLMVIQTLLGNWSRTSGHGPNSSSKLCQDVAMQECAHSISAFTSLYKDTGIFGVYAIGEPTKLEELAWYLMDNMVRLGQTVSQSELDVAKAQLKASMVMHLDGCNPICEDIGRQMLVYGRRMTPAELFARIDTVSIEDVTATAFKYVNDQDIAVSASGPIHELPDYNWLRRRTYWLRA